MYLYTYFLIAKVIHAHLQNLGITEENKIPINMATCLRLLKLLIFCCLLNKQFLLFI